MNLEVAGALKGEFRTKTELLNRQRILHHERDNRERRERRDKLDQDASELADMALMAVTAVEIETFRADLDHYDAATVMALEDNRRALETVRASMDALLAEAYVLPDGRRVFKTEDGTQVFDEFGDEVEASVIDPDLIDNRLPRWEAYAPLLDQQNTLKAEQTELLDYQEKLDAARERLDSSEITREEFDALRDELKDTMPDAVRAHVPGMEPEAEAGPDADPPSMPRTAALPKIAADMVPGG